MWRIFQLNKHLTRPGHVWSKFGSGNRESLSKAAKELQEKGKLPPALTSATLNVTQTPISSRLPSPAPSQVSTSSEIDADGGTVGRETRRRLVEWWSKEYCASRMRLSIVGKGQNLGSLKQRISNTDILQNPWMIWPIWRLAFSRLFQIVDVTHFQ